MCTITLLCDPARPCIAESDLQTVASSCEVERFDWLDPGVAAEFKVGSPPPDAAALEDELRGRRIDFVAQSGGRRRMRMLVADMDSTIIRQECIDELAAEAGCGERVAAITAKAMNGEIDFADALRERVATLAGLPESIFESVWRRIEFMPGAAELLRTMRANGACTVLISGGFTEFTKRVSEAVGFDEHYANELVVNDGELLGAVREPVLGRDAKPSKLREVLSRTGIKASEVMAVGDGANDVPMLRMAGCGVAFRSKPSVAAQCPVRVDHCDLTALLYLQGIRKADFAAVPEINS